MTCLVFELISKCVKYILNILPRKVKGSSFSEIFFFTSMLFNRVPGCINARSNILFLISLLSVSVTHKDKFAQIKIKEMKTNLISKFHTIQMTFLRLFKTNKFTLKFKNFMT